MVTALWARDSVWQEVGSAGEQVRVGHLPTASLDMLVRDLRLSGANPAGALRPSTADEFLMDAWSSCGSTG
jgi:hypothetical protein